MKERLFDIMMKLRTVLRTLAVIIVMLAATTAWADDSGYCGDPNVHGGQDVTWSLADVDGDNVKETLSIIGTGAMVDYQYNHYAPWYDSRESIKTVVIVDGVTSIGGYAFYGCSGLTSVTIPNSVTSIGDYAFSTCSGLTSITIPSSVTSIGDYAFSTCSGLTSVTIPSSVESIGGYAFYGCTSLTSVVILAPNLTTYGSNAFDDNANGRKIYVPNADKYQTGWSSYSDVIVEFNGYCGDPIVNDGKKVVWVLTDEDGDNVKETLTIVGTVKMEDYSSNTPWYDSRESIKTVVIENGVTSIGNSAFTDCESLTSVTIPSSVTSIGSGAFYDCKSLTSVTIPSNVTSIGDKAFSYCISLTSVNIPSNVTSIRNETFFYCTSLTSVTIPSNVTSIGGYAFSGCSSLTSVTILSNVTSIGGYAFSGCSNLTSVTIPSSVESIGGYAFSGCSAIETITVDEGNPTYDSHGGCNAIIETTSKILLYGCMNTVIPNDVTSIEELAFSDCSGLTSVTIPSSVTSIGNAAFYGCTSLTSVVILAPELTTYGDNAFDENANDRKIYVPSGSADKYQTGWSSYSSAIVEFDGYCGDDNVNDGKNVAWGLTDEDGDNVKETLTIAGTGKMKDFPVNALAPWYDNRESIKAVVIGNGVTSIGTVAFYDCKSLTSVTIPSCVTSINLYAFDNCTSLTSVTIPASVTSIGEDAFFYCTSLTSVTIPSSVTSIGEDAFYGCTNLTDVYCYADPDGLTWNENHCNDFIESPAKTTVCHVAGGKLATFLSKWSRGSTGNGGTDVNVIFMGDGIEPGGYDYVVGTVTYGSGTAPEGVKAFLPVAYDLSTATVTLAEIEGAGAPKDMPVIYGSAKVDEKMPDLFFLNYVDDDSDDATDIQSNYDSKANAMSKRFLITKGDKTLTEILSDAGVSASEAIFFVLRGGKFRAVDVSSGDLEKTAKSGLLLFILSKWEYMQVGSNAGGGSANSRGIGIGDGGATSLTPIPSPTGEGSGAQWYDLQGRRIDKPARKGVYIHHGKKVVIK